MKDLYALVVDFNIFKLEHLFKNEKSMMKVMKALIDGKSLVLDTIINTKFKKVK